MSTVAEKQTQTRKKSDKSEESSTSTVSKIRITAGPCPVNENHSQTRIYSTKGRKRHCICDECGAAWVKTGVYAEEWREFASRLAESLDLTQRQDVGGNTVILMPDGVARELAADLRRLASSVA